MLHLVKPLLGPMRTVLESAWFFELQQRVLAANLEGVRIALREELAIDPPDSVLDVCCGIGNLAGILDADYVGVDINRSYVDRARARFLGDPRRRFVLADALAYPVGDKSFHTALFVNALHHFDAASAKRLLEKLRRATRRRILVVDPAGETDRVTAKLLIALDQGAHIRSMNDQRAVLESAGLIVERNQTFYTGLAHLRLWVCRPEPPLA